MRLLPSSLLIGSHPPLGGVTSLRLSPPHLRFLQLLLNGTYDYVRRKILYVFLDHFPDGGRQDGWIADDYLRTFLTQNGLSRVVGARPDDVFVINDADEIPAREGLLFLKLFDGWTEPFAIHMRKVRRRLLLLWLLPRLTWRLRCD